MEEKELEVINGIFEDRSVSSFDIPESADENVEQGQIEREGEQNNE